MPVNLKPITTPTFLVCLFLLVLNDLYLKIAFHNAFTGKLSDICGLFIFPIFWSALFPRRKLRVYILTALFFIYWKSSYSQSFIDLFSLYLYPIQRTVDYTDLLTLLVLPLSWYFQSSPQKRSYLNPYIAGLITFFSFCATSIPRAKQHFEQPQYVLFQSPSNFTDSGIIDQGLRVYNFDSLYVVKVNQIALDEAPVKDDDFNKNLILKDLEQRVSMVLPGQDKLILPEQINRLTIKTNEYQDFLMFKGSRLHGKFLRKDEDQILIDGRFKNGIEDSVWTFFNPSRGSITKKTFKNGETTQIQEFAFSQLTSSTGISTRKDTRIFKGFQLALLLTACVIIVIRLRKNHKKPTPNELKIKTLHKFLLAISLPFLTWLIQLIIWTVIPDHYSAPFNQIFTFFYVYVIGTPIFIILLFWVKHKKQTDILWYCLLLSLLFVFWREAMMLNLLLTL